MWGKIHGTHEKVHYTSKKLEIWGMCGGMDIEDVDNDEKNIKLCQIY